ncbi:hypothetical protein LR48_Vigan07g062400 [Vigna angularis]|uniref:Uncharacterized protein n=1 Tax=Phaseolus angularis TaxID=3914 RepID=A0A0L9UVP0_PHAAN|nr:hypothetical protein LR48_Vigan07g062400 [Vigna angularis]
MQEMKEMLQEIKIHIKGLERREKFVMKGKKEGETGKDVVQDSLLDIKKAKKPSYGGESSTNSEKKRETEAAVLSVDGFARIRGQDRREENICGEEDNDENYDGDISVTAAEKVAKAVVFTAAEKVAKAAVFTAAEKVAKVVVFRTLAQPRNSKLKNLKCDTWMSVATEALLDVSHCQVPRVLGG